MVAIARALMSRPRVLLLDEPLAGLSPSFVAEIGSILETLKQRGTTMLLVEQNLALAMRVGGRFYILRAGEIVKSGDIGELRESPAAGANLLSLGAQDNWAQAIRACPFRLSWQVVGRTQPKAARRWH